MVRAPGQYAAINRSAAAGTVVTSPASCFGLRTRTGSGTSLPRRLAVKIARVATGTAASHGCTCDHQVTRGYPVTINDHEQAALTQVVTTALLGADHFAEMPRARLGAEDFSYVLQQVPGAMAFLGVCPADEQPATAAPNHSNLMRVNESALTNGVALYAAMALAG